jgi:integrase
LALNLEGKKITEASVCIHVRNAKTAFNHAVREDLIMFNPFDRLKGNAPEPDKDWKYVTLEELGRLLDACPGMGWRMLIALCRLAGLRRGEALDLTWSNVGWQKHRLTIIAEKTGQRRVTPVEPKLYELLLDAFDQAENGVEQVCAISKHCLWRISRLFVSEPGWRNGKTPLRLCEETVRLTGHNDIHNMQYQLGLGTVSKSQRSIICRFQRNCMTRSLPQMKLELPQNHKTK